MTLAAVSLLAALTLPAPPPSVALTFDDLPWVGPLPEGERPRDGLTRIAATLRVHDAPATGFVICDRVGEDADALRTWADWRLTLGNHSAAHRDLERSDPADWAADVERCDTMLRTYGAADTRFFRYPMLHTGGDAARRTAAQAVLQKLELRTAHVSIDTSDWLLARAYGEALERGDGVARAAIGRAFVEHVLAATDHADAVARRKTGSTIPHVLLLHANALVADHLDALLLALRARGLAFVSLDTALDAQPWRAPDGYLGPRGFSWLYRRAPATPEDSVFDDAQAAAIETRFPRRTDPAVRVPRAVIVRAPDALRPAIAAAASSERMRALLVMHRGDLVAESYFNGADADEPLNLKSVTKSLTSALVGVALRRGFVTGLDDPVARYLPQTFARHADKAGVTLRHLLTMRSGLPAIDYDTFQHSGDPLDLLLTPPLAHPPGTTWTYDTTALQLVTAVLQKASGMDAATFAQRELLGPLGGDVPYWRRDCLGTAYGGNDAFLRPRDLVRLGELYRTGGMWNGQRLLDEAFVRESVAPRWSTGEPTINHATLPVRGYGLAWWALDVEGDDVFAALGHGGQELLVLPRRELVVLATSRWPGPSSTAHYEHLRRVMADVIQLFPRRPER